MYREHFGLTEAPFAITPDTAYFFACARYQDALNTLLIAARSGEGFIKVTGEVGTGKTLLCRKFLASLGEDFVTAFLPNPYLQPHTLLLALADELELAVPAGADPHQLLKILSHGLMDYAARGRRVVVCLDEAQAMPLESLEALRLLSNLETEKRKLLQVVLFGQPELDVKLDEPCIRQLKQRIVFQAHLSPLREDELTYYLANRLTTAGYRGGGLFSRDALKALYRASRGVPRLVNILAHKALLLVYGEGGHRIERRHIRLAVADTPAARSTWPGRALLRRLWLQLKSLRGHPRERIEQDAERPGAASGPIAAPRRPARRRSGRRR